MNDIKVINGCSRIGILLMGGLLALSGCAVANNDFVSPLGKKVSSNLDSVSVSYKSKTDWILGGYIVQSDGNNLPYISVVPIDGEQASYWPLGNADPLQIFERKGRYYVLLSTGKAVKVEHKGLSEADFKFKPNSLILSVEPKLVACTKIGFLTKRNASKMANCYSVDGSWETDVYWTRMDVAPKVCGDNLKVLVSTDNRQKWEVISLDTTNGKQLSSKKVAMPEMGASVCQL